MVVVCLPVCARERIEFCPACIIIPGCSCCCRSASGVGRGCSPAGRLLPCRLCPTVSADGGYPACQVRTAPRFEPPRCKKAVKFGLVLAVSLSAGQIVSIPTDHCVAALFGRRMPLNNGFKHATFKRWTSQSARVGRGVEVAVHCKFPSYCSRFMVDTTYQGFCDTVYKVSYPPTPMRVTCLRDKVLDAAKH